MLSFRRKPEPQPEPPACTGFDFRAFGLIQGSIMDEQEHICALLEAERAARAAQRERDAGDLDRIQTRLARIEATLQRFDLWAAARIEGWPGAGGD